MFSALSWHNPPPPSCFSLAPTELSLTPPKGSDFWRKTYYDPPFQSHSAPSLQAEFPVGTTATITAHLLAVHQFDQAGLLVYVGDKHWIKFGFEFCDDDVQLGAVVTNDFSDWSTMKWDAEPVARLRIHRVGSSSVALETAEVGGSFRMIRIAHLGGESDWRVGPFAASPTAEGGKAVFKEFAVETDVPKVHKAEL